MKMSRVASLLAACVFVALAASCGPSNAQEGGAVTIMISGDVRGEYAPCGCKANPSGGLAKRAFYASKLREKASDLLIVDVGNQFHEHPSYGPAELSQERSRANLFIDVMNHMKITASTPGALEFALGGEEFGKQVERSKYPWLAANLIDQKTGKPIGPTTLVVPAGGYRVGLFGVVSRDLSYRGVKVDAQGYEVRDPIEAAVAAVAELKGKADFVVALAHLNKDETRKFVDKVKGVAFVLAGNHSGIFSQDVQDMGGVPVLQVPARGREVGVLRIVPKKGEFKFVNRSERDAIARRIEFFEGEKKKIEDEAQGKPVEEAFAQSPATLNRYRTFVEKIDEQKKKLARVEGDSSYFEFSTVNLGQDMDSDMQVMGWMTKFADLYGLTGIGSE